MKKYNDKYVNLDVTLRDTPEKQEMSEIRYYIELIKKFRFDVVLTRILYHILKKIYKDKRIWLFFDRVDNAKDNAEALYSYCKKNSTEKLDSQNIKAYFIIGKKSKDYKRLKQKGYDVIIFNSLKHKLFFLLSEKIISVQTTYYVYNVFSWDKPFYVDLYKFKYIFLQHGVIHSDLSSWLNNNKKKIDLFVTTAKREYDSIISIEEYGFCKDIVKVLGLARYDKLYRNKDKHENIILIMPTWRSKIIKTDEKDLYKKLYSDSFKETDYYNFFNNLITSPLIKEALKKYNYKIKFQLHPNMIQQASDFEESENVIVCKEINEFCKLLSEARLLVTDYSSIAFDFAYLKKPIIYCQYDIVEFYSNHTSKKGYFDYKDDGFGEVTKDMEEAINKIVKSIENGCKMEEKYLNRVDDFFEFIDDNNSERTYREIINMENNK